MDKSFYQITWTVLLLLKEMTNLYSARIYIYTLGQKVPFGSIENNVKEQSTMFPKSKSLEVTTTILRI